MKSLANSASLNLDEVRMSFGYRQLPPLLQHRAILLLGQVNAFATVARARKTARGVGNCMLKFRNEKDIRR